MLGGYLKLESNWDNTMGILAAFYWVMMSNFCKVSLISGEYCYEPLEKRPRFWATHQVPKYRSNHPTSWLLGLSFCSGFSQSTMRTLCPIAGLSSRPFIVNPHPREAGNERGDPQTLESCKWGVTNMLVLPWDTVHPPVPRQEFLSFALGFGGGQTPGCWVELAARGGCTFSACSGFRWGHWTQEGTPECLWVLIMCWPPSHALCVNFSFNLHGSSLKKELSLAIF